THTYSAPGTGRYEVRVIRTNTADITNPGSSDLIVWGALKSVLTDGGDPRGVTQLGVTLRASDSLNSQTSRLVNVIVQRKIPVWDGLSWSVPQASRSIAWAAADILRNQDYGAGLTDDQIDLDGLLELDAIWTERGDTFNGIFDQATTVWDALAQVLRTGRARAYQQGGKIRFHRDQAQTIPVGMFS